MGEDHRPEFLQDAVGQRVCMIGNLAIVRGALEAGVRFVSCYPGTPSSEIGDAFARFAHQEDIFFEYSINEKITVEIAFAASLTGARSLCSMKHLGLSYAGDPIATMPYVGVEGGMVIVSAGEPSLITSTNEQDQRHLTRYLYYPIFDPATPDDARTMTRFAFEVSEATRLPVIMRPTTRVCHGSALVELGPLPKQRTKPAFQKNPPRYVPIPANARKMRTELTERYRHAETILASSPFFPRTGCGRKGIIASGIAYTYAEQVIADLGLHELVTLQKIGAYPIPEAVLSGFLGSVDAVLVVEELTPLVEEWVSLSAFRAGRSMPVLGKHSGHFPVEFEYDPDLVEEGMRQYLELDRRPRPSVEVPELPARPPVLCPGCPHRASFNLVSRVFGKKTVYSSDIGCYTLGYGEPLNACDILLCMGSSICQASAISRTTDQRVVAYIGDSTFFHSGLPALVNAVQADDEITVVILDNHITAMTGFQPSMTTDAGTTNGKPAAASGAGPTRLDIEDVVRGLGVADVTTVDPFCEEEGLAALKQAKAGRGVNAIVFRSPCVVYERRAIREEDRPAYVVDDALCNSCSLCVRALGCPAIMVIDGRYVIDEELCDGCDLCAQVCRHGAIAPVVEQGVKRS
ncbi:MAG: indolepyruvate ferredoxin oxidoreductase subunit alpha [Phycisphaerae bacterium]